MEVVVVAHPAEPTLKPLRPATTKQQKAVTLVDMGVS